jgi:ferric-dicitrate binding protein FerR (iron transport regulator)
MSDCTSIRDRFFAAGELERGNPELEAHLEACEACARAAAALPLVDAALATPPAVVVPSFDAIALEAARAARTRRGLVQVRRRLPYAITGVAAAAAAVALVFLVLPSGSPRLAVGGALDSAAGARAAELPSGAKVRLDGGELRLVPGAPGEERLHLAAGAVSVEVPKLAPGHALAVETPDAEIRVHGTRFQVTRDRRGTSVSVIEGLVEVRPGGTGRAPLFLRPGEATVIEPLDDYRRGLRASAQANLDAGRFDAADEGLAALLATAPGETDRAEALALRAWAAAARGDRKGAIDRYREALGTLPVGERALWADNAAAELALLLEGEDPAAAAAAWSGYLRRFPEGVHSSLARARAEEAR